MSTRRAPLAAVLILGLAVGLSAGCAAGTQTPPAGGSVSPSESTSPTPDPRLRSPAPTPVVPSLRPSPSQPTKTSGEQTITGQVIEGVEPGCRLLRTASGDYLLIVPPRMDASMVRAGARLSVRGRVDPGVLTTCQQGTPFMVSAIGTA